MAASYLVVGAALLWSRLYGLGHSFWFDEIFFVVHFVRPGIGELVAGPGLSHEFYGVLLWAATALVGESETAFRLLSAIPFIVGVLIVAVWLHRRLHPVAGLTYLFLATVSPLLLDITRQARGYGLAFFAMSILIVAGLEADRTGRALPVAVACAAGVIGAWTLPQVGIAFVAICLVLAADPRLRKPALVGLVASVLAIWAWYAPHQSEVRGAAQGEAGLQISTTWLVTAPIDQVLIPATIWIEGVILIQGAIWLPLVILAAIVIGSSPLLRTRQPALILCSGVVATIALLWLEGTFIFPRYLSYLLVPTYILVASGTSAILMRAPRPAIARSVICLVFIGVLAVRFAMIAPDVVRLPREANRDAADVVEERSAAETPVLAYVLLPEGLDYYLERPFGHLHTPSVVPRVCGARRPVVYVMQPMVIEPVDVPCLGRPGVEHFRFRQYARGGEMNVWFVPPAT